MTVALGKDMVLLTPRVIGTILALPTLIGILRTNDTMDGAAIMAMENGLLLPVHMPAGISQLRQHLPGRGTKATIGIGTAVLGTWHSVRDPTGSPSRVAPSRGT